jgi:predicted oxidoreductase
MTHNAVQSPLPIALGCMGLTGTWNPAEMDAAKEKRAITAFGAALEAGITLYDHADIYGGGTCETVFKKCLEAFPEARAKIQIWTKGGIRPAHYNLSALYLTECIERSRTRIGIDTIDLYQLHRPDPFTHPADTAKALNAALKAGHIQAVGVSNYFPEQVRALQKYLDVPIVSNQFLINALRLAPFYEGWEMAKPNPNPDPDALPGMSVIGDGTLDFCMAENIVPLAYSPLAKAALSKDDATEPRLRAVQGVLGEIATERGATRTQIALAWLLAHPSGIIPIVGSANPVHIAEAAKSVEFPLERIEWYRIFSAGWGRRVP